MRVVEPRGFTKISALGVEEQRVRVIADITSPEEEWRRLADGYQVEAGFVLWEGKQVLQAPASALFRNADQWSVFVVEGHRARRRAVQVGHRNGFSAEILSGLSGAAAPDGPARSQVRQKKPAARQALASPWV